MLEVALGFQDGMEVVQATLRVDGESGKEVEKRCEEYGKRLVKEVENETKMKYFEQVILNIIWNLKVLDKSQRKHNY